MHYTECEIPEKVGYVIPIGDLHFSDNSFKKESYNKLIGYIQWVQDNPSSRIVLGGDIFNCASRQSKTSPFEQRMSVSDEMKEVVALLSPVKHQIAGGLIGNHEYRAKNEFDIDLMETLCAKLDIPYMGISGVINFKVGKRRRTTKGGIWDQSYMGYFHHSTGSGSTLGGPLNRTEKLGNIVEGCDFYCSFHSHKLSTAKVNIYRPSPHSKKVEERVINFITCGGYLDYKDSYAERGMLRPVKLGSPRIRLDSIKHDIHVSL